MYLNLSSNDVRVPDFHVQIFRYDSLSSTNTEAAEQARRGAAEGTVIVAREQTEGRGRHGRAWASPAGAGFYLSIILRPRFEIARFPLLTLLAALAVREALKRTVNLATDIKWSNDVLARGRKLCGILAETVETSQGISVVLGIGINLRQEALPPDVLMRATSVEVEACSALDEELLLRELLAAIRLRYNSLHETEGAKRLLDEFAKSSSYVKGKRVRVETGREAFEGVTCGLEPDGALRVELDGGEIRIVRAGDVSAVRAADANENTEGEW